MYLYALTYNVKVVTIPLSCVSVYDHFLVLSFSCTLWSLPGS